MLRFINSLSQKRKLGHALKPDSRITQSIRQVPNVMRVGVYLT